MRLADQNCRLRMSWVDEKLRRKQRWVVLIAALWMECAAGASYAFSIYSGDIKKSLRLDQSSIEMMGFFKDLGECLGVLAGFLYQSTNPRIVMAVGAALNHVGYITLWLTITDRLPWKPQPWHLFISICIAANSQTYFSTASIVTSVFNFPTNRGVVIGMLKGCIGLSSAVLTALWRAILPTLSASSSSSFILMLSVLPTGLALFLLPLVDKVELRQESETKSRFLWVCTPVLLLAVVLLATDLWSTSLSATLRRLIGLFVVLSLLCPVKAICGKDELSDQPLLQNETHEEIELEAPLSEKETETPLWKTATSVEYMTLMASSAMILGSGSAAINNIGQVATSLRFPTESAHAMVSIISASQFVGRFSAGALSDYLKQRWRVERLAVLWGASLSLGLSHAMVVASGVVGCGFLWVASVVMGLSFGAAYSVVPAVTSELFGLQRFAALYNILITGNPVICYVLSVWVAGYLYDSDLASWFEWTFGLMSCMCLLASVGFATLLWLTTCTPARQKIVGYKSSVDD